MEYAAFVFGIFGLMAYLQISTLKRRIEKLEEESTKTRGTSAYDARKAFMTAARSYIGKKVLLELKEDHADIDIVMYGNTKYGSNTLLDLDEDWMLIHIDSPKGCSDKLIRTSSVERISAVQE